ncbi:hypothetical protein PQX77_017283 [Marasmius sp. AFHP31]|nr:hypothetical protein PQX77_017283 [Marasmius sp. AFHP31]
MFLVYGIIAAIPGWLRYKYLQDILPLQCYLSESVGLFVIEMVATWGYDRYLYAHGRSTASTVFLIVGKLVLKFYETFGTQGLSVVRETLGHTMLKCQALAGARK